MKPNRPVDREEAIRLARQGLALVAQHGRNSPLITAVGDAAQLAGDYENALACYITAVKYDAHYRPAQEKYDALIQDLQAKKIPIPDIPFFDLHQYWDDTAEWYNALVDRRHQAQVTNDPITHCIADFVHQQHANRVLMPCCGVGMEIGRLHAAQPALQLVGLDWSERILACARARCGDTVEFIQGDVCRLPFPAHAFDCSFTVGGVMAVPDCRQALQEIRRVSRTGILLIEPSLEHIPPTDIVRGIRLITPGTWMHHYEALFSELHLQVNAITPFPTLYLTAFALTPLS